MSHAIGRRIPPQKMNLHNGFLSNGVVILLLIVQGLECHGMKLSPAETAPTRTIVLPLNHPKNTATGDLNTPDAMISETHRASDKPISKRLAPGINIDLGVVLNPTRGDGKALEVFLRSFLLGWQLAIHTGQVQQGDLLFVLHIGVCSGNDEDRSRISKHFKMFQSLYNGHLRLVKLNCQQNEHHQGANTSDNVIDTNTRMFPPRTCDMASIAQPECQLGRKLFRSGISTVYMLNVHFNRSLDLFSAFSQEELAARNFTSPVTVVKLLCTGTDVNCHGGGVAIWHRTEAGDDDTLTFMKRLRNPADANNLYQNCSVNSRSNTKPLTESSKRISPSILEIELEPTNLPFGDLATLLQQHVNTVSDTTHSCHDLWRRMHHLFADSHVETVQSQARQALEADTPGAISLLTQSSVQRLQKLPRLCSHWLGLIDIAVLISNSEQRRLALHLAKSSSCRSRLRLHLVFVPLPVESYPVNFLRNIALDRSTTDLVFLLDIDFLPSAGAHDVLWQFLRIQSAAWLQQHVVIVPAYQMTQIDCNATSIPRSKDMMVKLLASREASSFHSEHFWPAHGPTNEKRWRQAEDSYEVQWKLHYEPYMAGSRNTFPLYDPFMPSRLGNKASHSMHLHALRTKLVVHNKVFVVHTHHSPAPRESRKIACVRKLRQDIVSFLDLLRKKSDNLSHYDGFSKL